MPIMPVLCSFIIWCFTGMLFKYFLSYFEMDPLDPIITGITSTFTFHMHCFLIVNSAYFRTLSVSFLFRFLSP